MRTRMRKEKTRIQSLKRSIPEYIRKYTKIPGMPYKDICEQANTRKDLRLFCHFAMHEDGCYRRGCLLPDGMY